jgi:hypothetical protein
MVSLSGAVAEALFLGTSDADGIDQARVRYLADSHNIKPRRLRRLRRIITAKLSRHRDAVERVAQALLRRRFLTGTQIDQLIKES